MKRTIKLAGVVCVLALVAGWLLTATPLSPVAVIRVVDVAGKPIVGAVIRPDGLRPKKNGGHYLWTDRLSVPPTPVTTDSAGLARVPYPHFVTERLETGEISFSVEHPDYCSDRPFRVVAAAPPANASLLTKANYYVTFIRALLTRKASVRPDPVILQPGAIVAVSGYIGDKNSRVTTLSPMTSAQGSVQPDFWKSAGDGVFVTRRIPAGINHFRLVHFAPTGPSYFSDIVALNAVVGVTNRLDLELKPGVRVEGRLSEQVPRPVTNGRVVAEVVSEDADPSSGPPDWHVWSAISADGTFVFASMPRGRLEVVGICDGFVSENGPSKRSTGQRTPQQFEISDAMHKVTLKMEPAAAVEVQVLDDRGQPLAGARVSFWPNVLWNGWASTIFASGTYRSEDDLQSSRAPDWSSRIDPGGQFSAVSDGHGIALVRNLPETPGHQSFLVTHASFELPVHRDAGGQASRYAEVPIQSGETSRVTVKLQELGKEFVTH